MSKSQLKQILDYERELYIGSKGIEQFIIRGLKAHPDYFAWKYVRRLRTTSYFYSKRKSNLFYSLMYLWNCRKKNKLGRTLGIEINENNFGKGLMIYHTQGIVINGGAVIGENCKLHGNNCIGNNGKNLECPIIGNNVRLGVGAKVIGNVKIANNITIAAGAVVISSFEEEGITIAGVPAKKRK
ncbi:poly-gamma-glutamate biosynthesis protein [Bacillus sp. AFS006103]|nr:poly-gamma-glutamate biosynthesis protein [Bacillus sp. AFS006103]